MREIPIREDLERSRRNVNAGARALREKRREGVPPTHLAGAFAGLGMKPREASVAARGRDRMREAATDAAGLGPDAYCWVGDENDPATWLLQIAREDPAEQDGSLKFDAELVKYAVAHLPGIATYGQAVDIPEADLPDVKAKLRSAWVASDLDIADLPIELQVTAPGTIEAVRKPRGDRRSPWASWS